MKQDIKTGINHQSMNQPYISVAKIKKTSFKKLITTRDDKSSSTNSSQLMGISVLGISKALGGNSVGIISL